MVSRPSSDKTSSAGEGWASSLALSAGWFRATQALDAGIVNGIVWGLFGIFTGALYGLWAGRSVSARTLRASARSLLPDTSMVLAWAGEPVARATLDAFTKPDSQRLVLRFNTVEHGAILEAA